MAKDTGDKHFMTFSSEPFDLVEGRVVSHNVITRAHVLALCVRSDKKFTKDIARPDSKIWFIVEAELAYATNRDHLKCVMFATDGESYVPVIFYHLKDYFSIYAKRGNVPWQFGPGDQAIVKALMADKLSGVLV